MTIKIIKNKFQKFNKILYLLFLLMIMISLCGCANKTYLNEWFRNNKYDLEATNVTKNNEDMSFNVEENERADFYSSFEIKSGKMQIILLDSEDNIVFTANQNATLPSDEPLITKIENGKGKYKIKVELKDFTGTIKLEWKVEKKN